MKVQQRLIAALATMILSTAVTADDNNINQDDSGIAPQALDTALEEFAERSGLQVIYLADVAKGKHSLGAEPDLSDQATLDQLLASTDLKYEFLNDNTVTLQATNERGASDSKNLNPQSVLMAQNQTSPTTSMERSSRSEEGGTNDGSIVGEGENILKIPEILVIGRSNNVDIQRTRNDAQPYVTFDALEIEKSQVTTLEEFLRTRLPMNSAIRPSAYSDTGSNSSTINLRGLGTDQTLILINGRRTSSISNGLDFTQPDVNGIPIASIERIEVLPSTASGIYGGAATGGVINIILKSDYQGLELVANYDNTFDTNSAVRRFDLNGGLSFNGGKSNFMVSASYSDSDPLLVEDREFAERSRQLQLQNNPSYYEDGSFVPIGGNPNISAVASFDLAYFLETGIVRFTKSDLIFDDGTPLGSAITFVPDGYAGVDSDGGAALLANAGQYNLSIPNDLSGGGGLQSLVNNPTVYSVSASLQHEFLDNVRGYLELRHSANRGKAFRGGGFSQFTILPADAPNNPFTAPIAVSFPLPGVSFQNSTENEVLNVATGMVVDVNNDWGLSLDFSRTESDNNQADANARFRPGFSSDLSNGVIDVVRDLNQFPIDSSSYRIDQPTRFGTTGAVLDSYAARIAGPIFELPGGPINFTGLLERREQRTKESFITFVDTLENETLFFYPELRQDVSSAYAEITIPIFSAKNRQGFAELLDLQVAVRYDRYKSQTVSDFTDFQSVPSEDGPLPDINFLRPELSSTDFTIGGRYSPVDGLILRASYGTGFLPPSVAQLTPVADENRSVFIADPQRGGETERIVLERRFRGGNVGLDAEQSKNLSVGLIFAPKSIDGLRLSVDYTKISKTDEIGNISTQELVDRETEFQDRIVRAPLEPDAPANFTAGPITSLDVSLINIAATEVETIDFQLDYDFDIQSVGEFRIFSVATYFASFKQKFLDTDEFLDAIGFAEAPNDWGITTGLEYEAGPVRANWFARYYSSKKLYSSTSSDFFIRRIEENDLTDTLGSRMFHDINVMFDFDQSGAFEGRVFDGMQLTLGIRNLFNQKPQIRSEAGLGRPGFALNGADPRLRTYSVQLRKAF